MANGIPDLTTPANEAVRDYAPGSPERTAIVEHLDRMLAEEVEIPLIIGGQEVRTGDTATQVCPHDHGHVLATYHKAGAAEVAQAVEAAGWCCSLRWDGASGRGLLTSHKSPLCVYRSLAKGATGRSWRRQGIAVFANGQYGAMPWVRPIFVRAPWG